MLAGRYLVEVGEEIDVRLLTREHPIEIETRDRVVRIDSDAKHVSRKMLEHYRHIRVVAKRKALEGIGQEGHVPVNVTKLGTTRWREKSNSPQLIDKFGRGERI